MSEEPYAAIEGFRAYAVIECIGIEPPIGGPQYMSYTQDLLLDRGDEPTWPFTVYADDGSLYGDISSCTFKFTAKESTGYADARAVFQKATGSGISITDGPNSVAQIKLARADTNHLPPKKMRLEYDLQMITATGDILTLTRGILVVKPDVTRAES